MIQYMTNERRNYMNYRLAQFFIACSSSNFIDIFRFSKIYHAEDVTEDDKKAFLDWVEDNNLSISTGRGMIAFEDKSNGGYYDLKKEAKN